MPNNFGVTPIAPEEILLLLEKQLSQGGTPTNSIKGAGLGSDAFLSMWPDQLHLKNPRSKRFVALRPARFPLWQSIVQGAGTDYAGIAILNAAPAATHNTALGFNLVFTASCFVQINADPEMRSKSSLTEDVLGVITFVMKVISSLQFWCPKDKDLNELLREPCRMLDGGFSLKPVNVGDAWWVQSAVDFEAKFTAKLPTP